MTRDEVERFYDGTLPRPVQAAYADGGPAAVERLRLQGELHFFRSMARSQHSVVIERRRDGSLHRYMVEDLDLYERKALHLAQMLLALEDAR
jgi:hypothetical protein